MRQFKRSDRLSAQILRDISGLLVSELAMVAPGLVTFTRVKLSDDLRYARVYFSYLGKTEDRDTVTLYLEKERRHIRARIGESLRMRHIPEFDFRFDPSIEEAIRIEQLLNEIKGEGRKDQQN